MHQVDILGNISKEQFLKEYWQKKPLLIRQAYPNFEPLIPSDELAGMSLEEEVESRIIMENGPDSPWQLISGPFEEDTFARLPKDKWTLLIQGVDQWVPEAADLLQDFNFIPNWRIDDLMISFATDGGSVGPHYDQYDVFLLQAEGQREWRIGQMCSEQDEFLKETKLRLLAKFEETDRWVLEPGDMLYLPPRLAHYGISQGNGQTYSIGFRAPSQSELMHSLVDQIDASSNEDQRYGDPGLALQAHSGEINEAALQQVRDFMTQALADPVLLSDAIGKLMTEAKYPQERDEDDQKNTDSYLASDLKYDLQAIDIQRELHSRFAFNKNEASVSFYAGGKVFPINENSLELAQYLTQQRQYSGRQLQTYCEDRDNEKLLLSLWQDGHFFSAE
ncbi:MAG: 50S ribosomal protein L16 3-hydroxylase [Oleispira sp.]